MNPKNFLVIGGVVLIILGLAGFVGILGPTPDASIFGPNWWFDNGENWAHLVLGVAALVVAFGLAPLQSTVALLVGVLGLVVGVWGFLAGSEVPNFFGANLENPLDNILHVVVGIWALLSWRGAKSMGGSSGAMGNTMPM